MLLPQLTEDGWAVMLGAALLASSFTAVLLARPPQFTAMLAELEQLESVAAADPSAAERLGQLRKEIAPNPLANNFAKLQSWRQSPREAFQKRAGTNSRNLLPAVLNVGLVSLLAFGLAAGGLGERPTRFAVAFVVLFGLAVLAYGLASHEVVKHYNLEYPLWALLVGLVISNTLGTPEFLRPAVKTEFYIKTGIVLLGAKLLLGRLLALGLPGVFVSWVVTPVVLVSTFWFGQRILKIASPSLNMTISADMSVCGVSAAIATAAACRAKKGRAVYCRGHVPDVHGHHDVRDAASHPLAGIVAEVGWSLAGRDH